MRKGWKTRIDEREYFEGKQQSREERQALLKMLERKMYQDYKMQMEAMKENHEIN